MTKQTITLNTGAKMPTLGLGTWKSSQGEVTHAVEYALTNAGYRHIDCAAIYGNEQQVGTAFHNVFSSGAVKREDVFITSKLWNTEHEPARVEKACRQTLADLQLDYLDLYLMHWGIATPGEEGMGDTNSRGEPLDKDGYLVTLPVSIRETWEAMEKLVDLGLVKAIGVANFTIMQLHDLLTYARIRPAVNQVELHPYNQQQNLVNYCHRHGIVVTAYSPLGSPGNKLKDTRVLDDEVISHIAQAHGKTPAQVLLRWGIQRDTIVIPKSTHDARIQENIDVFDFELSDDEMKQIAMLDRKFRYVDPVVWWGISYFE